MTHEQTDTQREKLGSTIISRRQLIKASGIAALGLSFGAPLIQTVSAKPAFTRYGDEEAYSGSWGDNYWQRRRQRRG